MEKFDKVKGIAKILVEHPKIVILWTVSVVLSFFWFVCEFVFHYLLGSTYYIKFFSEWAVILGLWTMLLCGGVYAIFKLEFGKIQIEIKKGKCISGKKTILFSLVLSCILGCVLVVGYCRNYIKPSGSIKTLQTSLQTEDEIQQSENADDLYYLGTLYENGKGVEQNYTTASEYYEEAAKLGNSDSMCALGMLYYFGRGVEQNYTIAREWWEKAAELENPTGMHNLAIIYINGKGVKTDYLKAKELWERAAELGDAGSMYQLGNLYYYGNGVEQNYDTAEKWYEKAAELGDENAKEALESLSEPN